MKRAATAALLALAAAGASAQDATGPEAYATPEEMERFRLCRAAVFYHLDGEKDPNSLVPRPVARTLLDQINFVMAEAILNRTLREVDDGQRLIEFTESFFIGFNRTIARERARLSDVAARDAVLLDCIPWIWITARGFVDDLIRFRQAMRPGPGPRSPEAAQAQMDSIGARLGVRE